MALAASTDRSGAGGLAAAQDIAQTYNLLNLLTRLQGNADEAERYGLESVARYEAIADIAGAEKALSNLASVRQIRGDVAGTLAYYQRSQ